MLLDTQKITHEIRMKHWMQIIAQRQQSGLTVKEFCAQQDIPTKQYYYWQHKLRIRFAPAQALETKKEEVPTLVPLSAAIPVQDFRVGRKQCRQTAVQIAAGNGHELSTVEP